MDITPSYDLSSDHSPVIATVSTEVVIKQMIPRLHNSRTNWNNYRTQIDETGNLNISLKNHAELDTALSNFISLLNEAALKSMPIPKKSYKKNKHSHRNKKLLAAKRKARKKWQQSHAPSNKTAFNKTTNTLKVEIKSSREQSFQTYLRNFNHYNNSIWKSVKSTKKPIMSVSPLGILTRGQPDKWARSDKEKAELFTVHLSKVFTPNNNQPDQEIEENIIISPLHIPLIKILSLKEIQEEISSFKNKKAPGIDITPKMLKELPKKGLVMLTYIIQCHDKTKFLADTFKDSRNHHDNKARKRSEGIIIVLSNQLTVLNKQTIRETCT
jgi:hypothetical protein